MDERREWWLRVLRRTALVSFSLLVFLLWLLNLKIGAYR
jgi:hypothetical protein